MYAYDKVIFLYEQGYNITQIANELGMSRQRVSYVIKHPPNRTRHHHWYDDIKYPNLRSWFRKNKLCVMDLREMGICYSGTRTINRDMRKSSIDTILALTGMTYEECFSEVQTLFFDS